MARLRREQRQAVDIWPGFVDALSTLILAIIFLLVVFVLAQFFMGQVLQGRTEAVSRLQGQVTDLTTRLGLEQDTADELRRTMAQINADLQQAFLDRDTLSADLGESETARSKLAEQMAALTQDQALMQRTLDEMRVQAGQNEVRKGELERELAARDLRVEELLRSSKDLEARLGGTTGQRDEAVEQVRHLTEQIGMLSRQLAELDQALDLKQSEIDAQGATIANLGQRLNVALANKVEELAQYRSEFFGALRRVLGERSDVRVVGDRFVFQSEVLFQSGSADIEPSGRDELAKLADALKEILDKIPPDLPWVLQVDGHTDKLPISNARFPSNWELSTARAIAVARFLSTQGIPPDRLAARGFAEFQPLDPAESPEAYARNRRIEIKLTTR